MKYKFSEIYLHRIARPDPMTSRLLQFYSGIPVYLVEDEVPVFNLLRESNLDQGKKTLWITHFKGRFLKPCPGTASSYRCCNYLVINETTNCPIDCSYCILQGYISHPAITVYTNSDRIEQEIRALSGLNPDRILRVGTGELTDSLALDPVTGLSQTLIRTVQSLPNVLLELKTKTDHIGHLLHNPPDKVVLSWSVNPHSLVRSDERKSAGIDRRLKAAGRAQKSGFLVGLHFDPILFTPDWRNQYLELIDQIAAHLTGERIAWISLGSLRFPSSLREIIKKRFPGSTLLSGEMITGQDGKIRYIRPLREEMYRTIIHHLRQALGDVFLYFCMERQRTWKDLLGADPANNLEIDWYFAEHLFRHFPKLLLPPPRPETYHTGIRFPE